MKVTAPKGLGTEGRKVWSKLTGRYEFRDDELRVLRDACKVADTIEELEVLKQTVDAITEGSMRQPIMHPIFGEIRSQQALLAKLLGQLKIPDEDAAAKPSAEDRSAAARHAANARWGNQRGA